MKSFSSLALSALLVTFGGVSNALKITAPNGTSILEYTRSFPVVWENDQGEKNPVTLYVYGGYGAGLKQLDVIVSNTANTGKYNWYVGSATQTSGCNYALLAISGGTRVFSEYFSINNNKDGGLPLTSNCTSLATNPQTPTLAGLPDPSVSGSTSTRTSGSSSTSTSSPNSSSSGSSSSTSSSNSANRTGADTSRGISPTLLGGIIAGVVALLAIVGIIAWVLLRRRSRRRQQLNPNNGYNPGMPMPPPQGYTPGPPPPMQTGYAPVPMGSPHPPPAAPMYAYQQPPPPMMHKQEPYVAANEVRGPGPQMLDSRTLPRGGENVHQLAAGPGER